MITLAFAANIGFCVTCSYDINKKSAFSNGLSMVNQAPITLYTFIALGVHSDFVFTDGYKQMCTTLLQAALHFPLLVL